MINEYLIYKEKFLSGQIKGCRSYFEDNKYYTEAGYCCIILDNLRKAKELFQKNNHLDTRAQWGLVLLQLIDGKIKNPPTYLQIRNFLEIDLNIFLLYRKEKYLKKILRYTEYLFFYNPETYKFVGRVFWANGFLQAAMYFLELAKDKFYQDPELHYLLAYIYYNDKNYDLCKMRLDACLEILPLYDPAVKLYKKLTI